MKRIIKHSLRRASSGAIAPFPLEITVGDYGEPYLARAHAVSVELGRVGFEPTVKIVNRRDFGERVWLGGEYQLMMGPPARRTAIRCQPCAEKASGTPPDTETPSWTRRWNRSRSNSPPTNAPT